MTYDRLIELQREETLYYMLYKPPIFKAYLVCLTILIDELLHKSTFS